MTLFSFFLKIDLMPHDLITQLLRVLAIETKQEKAMVHADPTELTLSGLEAFSFDYVVKWPLSLIINRCALVRPALASVAVLPGLREGRVVSAQQTLGAAVHGHSCAGWAARLLGYRTASVVSEPRPPCAVSLTTSKASGTRRVSRPDGVPCAPSCRKALTRYQMLFRHMFYCKHVERQLCSVWISNKAAKQYPPHSAKWCVPRLAGRPAHSSRKAACLPPCSFLIRDRFHAAAQSRGPHSGRWLCVGPSAVGHRLVTAGAVCACVWALGGGAPTTERGARGGHSRTALVLTQVCGRLHPAAADAQLCSEHSVLHDV